MIVMKDTAKLAETVSDGYGDSRIQALADIDCLFLQGTGNAHAANVDIATSDAHAYLDINHTALTERGYRVEGMYMQFNPFGATPEDSWYKITRVVVGQRKLLNNEVDNVHVFLQKVAEPLRYDVS